MPDRVRVAARAPSVRHGAQVTGSDAPKIATTGTPNAAAMCAGPLSLPMNSAAPDIRLLTRASGSFFKTRNYSNGANRHPVRPETPVPGPATAGRLRQIALRATSYRARMRTDESQRNSRDPVQASADSFARGISPCGTPSQNIADARCSAVCTGRSIPRISCARGNPVRVEKTVPVMPESGADSATRRTGPRCCASRHEDSCTRSAPGESVADPSTSGLPSNTAAKRAPRPP